MTDRLFRRHRAWHALITDAVSGRADEASRQRLDAHVARCDACRTRLEDERRLRAALQSLPLREPSRSLRLTAAMLEHPRAAPSRRAAPGPVLLLAARGIAAAAVAAFAVVALLALASPADDGGSASLASREQAEDTVAPMAAPSEGESADHAAPLAPFAATPGAPPGLASPPAGGGAPNSDRSPDAGGPSGDTAADHGEDRVADGSKPGEAAENAQPAAARSGGPAEGSRVPSWLLLATGAAAAAALAALAGLEIARRK